ncbi:MAG: oligosaccharide flippase family protein [Ignavibacteria bacterium]|nr:oligosaccharide flippase family protein [Ignavibacteria bacterium]
MTVKKSHAGELLSHSVIYGLGIILNKSVNFILLPLYTNYFPPEQIGLFTLVQSISLFLGVIYTFGLETSFMKYFIEADDLKRKSEIYSSVLISLLATSFLLSFLIFSFSGSISSFFKFEDVTEGGSLIRIMSIVILIDTLYRFPLLLFRADLNTKTYTYLNIFTFTVNLLCNLIFIAVLKKGVESIFYSYIISAFVTFAVGLLITRKYLTLKISASDIKELFVYGNKFIYIGIFLILIDMSDRFFLKYYFDESLVGIYWANYRLATVMSLLISAFRFSWTPYFLNLASNPDNKKIISGIFTYFVFAGLLLFVVFSIFMDQIVSLNFFGFNFLDVKYWSGISIVPVVMLAYFLSGLYSVLNAAPFFTDKTGSLFAFALSGLLINLLLNFLLIPKTGIMGAAFSTLLTYGFMTVIIYIYSQRIYNISYDWKKIRVIILMSIIVFVTGYYFVNGFNISSVWIFLINVILVVSYLTALNKLKIVELQKFKKVFNKN